MPGIFQYYAWCGLRGHHDRSRTVIRQFDSPPDPFRAFYLVMAAEFVASDGYPVCHIDSRTTPGRFSRMVFGIYGF